MHMIVYKIKLIIWACFHQYPLFCSLIIQLLLIIINYFFHTGVIGVVWPWAWLHICITWACQRVIWLRTKDWMPGWGKGEWQNKGKLFCNFFFFLWTFLPLWLKASQLWASVIGVTDLKKKVLIFGGHMIFLYHIIPLNSYAAAHSKASSMQKSQNCKAQPIFKIEKQKRRKKKKNTTT